LDDVGDSDVKVSNMQPGKQETREMSLADPISGLLGTICSFRGREQRHFRQSLVRSKRT